MKKIKALVLAAGYSRRMIKNKMLLPLGGSTVLENTIQAFLQPLVDEVAVVIGHQGEKIKKALGSYPLRFIHNPDYSQGMSASVRTGIKVLAGEPNMAGVLITPGDMPFIRAETVTKIIEAYQTSSSTIIMPQYQEKRGHPVFFDRDLFPELMMVSGDQGAREVVKRNLDKCLLIEVNDPGILIDLDCPESYAKWVNFEGR